MTHPVRVLVLSAGDNSGINFCRALKLEEGRYHLIGCDTSIYRLLNTTADERHLLPSPENADVYWTALKRLVQATAPDFIYAADSNRELALLSDRRDDLRVRHFLPPKAAVDDYEDKWRCYEYFRSAGLTVPETILVRTPADVDAAVHRFGRAWLRATHGSGGALSLPTSDPTLGKAWIERHKGWGRFTAAEVLGTQMVTWIGLWRSGELAVCQARSRLHWEYANLSPSGVTGITGAQSTTSDSQVHDVAMSAIASLPHEPHGIVSVDMTFDANRIPNPTEIQATRFYSSILFLAQAGLNLPHYYVQMGLSDTMPVLESRLHPLPNDLVWLKAVDCLPSLTTMREVCRLAQEYTLVTRGGPASGLEWPQLQSGSKTFNGS
jgi:hypothetical protein